MERPPLALDAFSATISAITADVVVQPKQRQGRLDAEVVAHDLTIEGGDFVLTTCWGDQSLVYKVRYHCTCGWKIGWHSNLKLAHRKADQHASSGQFAWNFG